ncbi:hypothetical protein ABH930_007424 [Kitasatospora sp. GAS204A]|nr:hypothetical protein [Kitasatospora sp. GAS204B]
MALQRPAGYVRCLWDDPYTQLAIVFVGGECCYQTLRKEPMLSSRIIIWQRLARLSSEELLDVIPCEDVDQGGWHVGATPGRSLVSEALIIWRRIPCFHSGKPLIST